VLLAVILTRRRTLFLLIILYRVLLCKVDAQFTYLLSLLTVAVNNIVGNIATVCPIMAFEYKNQCIPWVNTTLPSEETVFSLPAL
jgi:hypothetical protein